MVEDEDESSPFVYLDTASSRAGINNVSSKLGLERVGIVGLGGTGSYILDLIVKTPIQKIVLFDGDVFSQHNAFRYPGAASLEQLRAQPTKVDYLKAVYSHMHRSIVPCAYYIDETNVNQLDTMTFVFLCLDKSGAKKVIIERLEAKGIPFIDVGMGVNLVEDVLHGVLRVTTSSPDEGGPARLRQRVSLADVPVDNDYDQNIQIADLNAMNACMAVIKWKKLFGVYADYEHEHNTTYTIDGNELDNEDKDANAA